MQALGGGVEAAIDLERAERSRAEIVAGDGLEKASFFENFDDVAPRSAVGFESGGLERTCRGSDAAATASDGGEGEGGLRGNVEGGEEEASLGEKEGSGATSRSNGRHSCSSVLGLPKLWLMQNPVVRPFI